jgi:hypothetical protein
VKRKFFPPHVIWFGVWLAFFLAIVTVGTWQNNLYQHSELTKSGQLQIIEARTVLPYAIAYLEEHQRSDLLERVFNPALGPYYLVLTDKAGNLKYAPASLPAGKGAPDFLKNQEFFYLFKDPAAQLTLSGPHQAGSRTLTPGETAKAFARLYLVPKESAGWLETLEHAYGNILTPSASLSTFTLLSYFLVLVGFAGICAITAGYQRHFEEVQERQYESELEARELRIQVLESNIKSADLRLELLDRSHEEAQTKLSASESAIADLEKAFRRRSKKNEELQESLQRAEAERNEALETIQSIELDREKIFRELKELEALREVEEMTRSGSSAEKARRPREFLWLNMVYQNLNFSRRAWQNIIELQHSPDIFPSLPDALATLNNSSAESLMAGESVPPRSVVRYTQSLVHHEGPLWEYRFSKDGRIFFGPSRSRTWNIDTILLKRKFTDNRYKYERYLEETLGKDNDDLQGGMNQGIENRS